MKVRVKCYNDRINTWIEDSSYTFNSPDELYNILMGIIYPEYEELDIYIDAPLRDIKVETTISTDGTGMIAIEYYPDYRGYAPKLIEFSRRDDSNFKQSAVDYIVNDVFDD